MTADSDCRLRIYFAKGESVRFLSHLDLLATMEYAMRRARLPFALSEGFNPRPRMSLAAPLAVGYLAEREVLEMTLREPIGPEEVVRRLTGAMPAGITILSAEAMAAEEKSAASRVCSAIYRMELPDEYPDLASRVATLLARSCLLAEDVREGKTRRRDLRPLIHDLTVLSPTTMRTRVALGESGTVRPEDLVRLLGVSREGVRVVRERLLLS